MAAYVLDVKPSKRRPARVSLQKLLSQLGRDEVRVLTRIAQRLLEGRRVYGALDLRRDRRAFLAKEAREEVEDFLVYAACAWLQREAG
jgi:hypothetical protein